MQQDVERFLQVLEAERGFSVNTIFAYRNDLTQFLAFLRGDSGEDSGRDSPEASDGNDISLAAIHRRTFSNGTSSRTTS